jgi:hypothetical protein
MCNCFIQTLPVHLGFKHTFNSLNTCPTLYQSYHPIEIILEFVTYHPIEIILVFVTYHPIEIILVFVTYSILKGRHLTII